MTTLTWLHISDLHLREKLDYDNSRILQALLRDIAKQVEGGLRPDFAAVTGDIAYSGKTKEYLYAERFFDDLLEAAGLDRARLFPVPGTHDINLKLVSRGARAIGDSLSDSRSVAEVLENSDDRRLMLRRLDTYREFVNTYFAGSLLFDDENYFYVRTLDQQSGGDAWPICILGLNSAWASTPGEAKVGGRILGTPQVQAALEQAPPAETSLRIALVHHPFERLRPFDRRESAPLLLNGVDFVLQGQMDDPGNTLVQADDARATVIAAGACFEGTDLPQTYNFVHLDLETQESQIHLRTYSDHSGGFWTEDLTIFPNAPRGVYSFPLRVDWKAEPEVMTEDEAAPDQVYVRELYVDNFRCFEQADIALSKGLTVLLGDNASGKSTILEALVIGVGAFFLGIDGVDPPAINNDQARLVPYQYGSVPTFEPQYPVRVSCVGSWGEQELKWSVLSKGKGQPVEREDADELADLARRLQLGVRQGKDVVLPLIAYYSTGRVWRVPESSPDQLDRPGSRFQGYDHCLDPASHVGNLMRWMRTQEVIASSDDGPPNLVYDAVKEAIRNCVDDLEDVSFDVRQDDIVAKFVTGQELPFRMLSEGVRNMLAMVADIAHRAALLNPGFGRDAAARTPGIVLIDELDLHLHPHWQQRVAADLSRTFPHVQFLATTHSPLIVGGLPAEQVFLLRPDGVIPMTEEFQGLRADQVLTGPAFGLESSRDSVTQHLIDEYSQLLGRDDPTEDERQRLEKVARALDLRLPSSAERKEAREAYQAIQKALRDQWLQKTPEELEGLMEEAKLQVIESTTGEWRPA